MNNLINFGIDLGTTNSAIAKFVKGEVNVFSNPQDYGRNTLPSVVAYRKDKIIVGSKAKEYLEKDPKSVVGVFKRKMGTTERFKISSINEYKSPIELSAQVLKELKTFVNTGETLDSIVITIPASFDTIQSNATKEAGFQAGFKQVVLLQEPIAASLAYANMKKSTEMKDGRWLVYDLGGGTFDVALIQIKDGEMKVIDHEGDNFLGGADFDSLIVDKFVIPRLVERYKFKNLEYDLKSASGKYNSKYYIILRRSEEAKIILSSKTSAEIVVDGLADDNGTDVDLELIITRSEFNDLIKNYIDGTIDMIKKIITKHSLKPIDLSFILMVGGSTYIPFVRNRIEEILQIKSNCEIDPTTAVAVGAAYYAGTKQKEINCNEFERKKTAISIKSSYNKSSKEADELFAAKVSGDVSRLNYRIVRQDGGYDSGIKKLKDRISEDLPLVKDSFNVFTLFVYDENNNQVETDAEPIGINSGFSISGQPIPEDICLEVDDYDYPGKTRLKLIFQKNSILPIRSQAISFRLNKTIIKGNSSDKIFINVLEGSHLALPEANKCIGFLEIKGTQVKRDIAKGSDIEIFLSISESRDISISAYLNMADQEFNQVFTPKERSTPINLLQEQINDLSERIDNAIDEEKKHENYENAAPLNRLKSEINIIFEETAKLERDDVTDKRYQLEDRKRKIAQQFDIATKDKRIQQYKDRYIEIKQECFDMLNTYGNDYDSKTYRDIISQEEAILSTNSPTKIQEKTDELQVLLLKFKKRSPEWLLGSFEWLTDNACRMNDQRHAKSLIHLGNQAIENEDLEKLWEVIVSLYNLLPQDAANETSNRIGFGI